MAIGNGLSGERSRHRDTVETQIFQSALNGRVEFLLGLSPLKLNSESVSSFAVPKTAYATT